jgi:deazaflavin-dependent oxidoreductase (nitroreductase family)
MSHSHRIPNFVWRLMKRLNLRIARAYKGDFPASRMVLLLTTTGRKSSLPRITPLQYEEVDGVYYVASARGVQADWFRNIQADPQVEVQVKEKRWHCLADAVTEPSRIADFLELRLKRHPHMLGMMLRMEGLPKEFSRHELEEFASDKAMLIIHPDSSQNLTG